jgi:hypothetical protein
MEEAVSFNDAKVIGTYVRFFDDLDRKIVYILTPLLWSITFAVIASNKAQGSVIGLLGMCVVLWFMSIIRNDLFESHGLSENERTYTDPQRRAALKHTFSRRKSKWLFFLVSWLILYLGVYLKSHNLF